MQGEVEPLISFVLQKAANSSAFFGSVFLYHFHEASALSL